MPIKFPHLKHNSDPLGLIEQIGAAVTVHPREDAARFGPFSWFGRLLSDDEFTWKLENKDGSTKDGKKVDLIKAYFDDDQVLYQVYDWSLTSLNINDDQGTATGIVRLKGKNELCTDKSLSGDYEFSYKFKQERVTNERAEQQFIWRMTEWTLKEM